MPIERKLAAIMFTDIGGYTALSAKDSTKASELLKTQRDTLKPIVEKHDGSWMKEIGDGLLLTFDSATSAVECSIAIQEATKDIEDLNLRIAIHQGEVIKQDGDVIGDDVNVTSRIEPFSAIGGVAISDKIYRDISSNQEFETKYIGKPKLKGVTQEVKVYCITSHGLPETNISKVSAKLEEESKFNIFALTGGILTAIGIAFWIAVGIFDVSFGGKTEVPSVGILMMENLGKEDEEFWSSGMTADLITKVAGAGLIRVAPLDDILKLDKDLSIEEKAKKLRVKYILTHSFLIKNDGFDLWCKLENTETGVALFSNKISEPMAMTTQMVGKLANDIVTSLKVETKQDVMKASTNNVEAYEYYLKAKHKYEKRENTDDTELARGLLNKAIELDDNLISAKILIGQTYRQMGDSDKAMDIYTQSLQQAKELDDKRGMVASLSGIGTCFRNNIDSSLHYSERALIIAKEIGDKGGIGALLNNIGNVYLNQFDYEKALDYLGRSLTIAEELGDKIGMGYPLINLGGMYIYKGDYETALDYLSRSLKIAEEIGDKYGMQHSINMIGRVYAEVGDFEMALGYIARSLSIAEEIGDKYGMGGSLSNIGVVHRIKGDYDNALDHWKKSLLIHNEIDDKPMIGFDLNNIGIAHYYKGNYEKAEAYLEKSLSIQKENRVQGIELETTIFLYLHNKHLGKAYDKKTIHTLIKENENIDAYLEYDLNYPLYKLLEDKSYLETAYNQIQENASAMDEDLAKKFLSYPIPKAIVEEWEKVK